MMDTLETKISRQYQTVNLEASLPASHLYEKRGYQTRKHDRFEVENGVILAYEVMEKLLHSGSTSICYDGRVFLAKENTKNGEADQRTRFFCHQNDDILWAEYFGGEIVRGNIIGLVGADGTLDFHYQHMNVKGESRIGMCHSIPHVLQNGKLELFESWKWLNGDQSEGVSVIVED